MSEILSFGAWVHQRRRALDLTQAELARRVGCAEVTVHKIETDERRPSRQVAALLAQHLQLPPAVREAFVRAARGELAPDLLPPPLAPGGASSPGLAPPIAAQCRTNLPAPPTPLIGRERELGEVVGLLRRPEVRLLTLTGAGGSGKTRLALEAAASLDAYPDGAWFVDLAPLRDPAAVAPTIVHALSLVELPGRAPAETLAAFLRPKRLLLLLDNFEQLAEAAPLLADLLASAPGMKLLVTSRVPLHLRAEHEYPVPPLDFPKDEGGRMKEEAGSEGSAAAADLHSSSLILYPAVQLFVERARAIEPHFALTSASAMAVGEICRRLDGLPLAIELAAARVRLFPPEALLARLEGAGLLATLVGGARDLPARQRTLRATLDWSFSLLNREEQMVLARLGVFAGSFELESAVAVCADSWADSDAAPLPAEVIPAVLEALLDHNLLRTSETGAGAPRFVLLETVRAYALERLEERGELEALRDRHLRHYTALAEWAEPKLRSGEQLAWLARLDAEYGNIRAALAWAAGAGAALNGEAAEQLGDVAAPEARPTAHPQAAALERAALGLRLAGALWYYWYLRGRFGEALRVLDAPWTRDERLPTAIRARARLGAWFITWPSSSMLGPVVLRRETLALARAAGDAWVLALALVLTEPNDDPHEAVEGLAIARRLGDPWLLAQALIQAAWWEQPERREAALAEALALARQTGDRALTIVPIVNHVSPALRQGNCDVARSRIEEYLERARALGSRFLVAVALYGLGRVVEELGEVAMARVYQAERLAIEREIDNPYGIIYTLAQMSWLAIEQSDYAVAQALIEEAAALNAEAQLPLAGWHLAISRAWLALERGDYAAAGAQARTLTDVKGTSTLISLGLAAASALAQGDVATAEAYYAEWPVLASAISPVTAFWSGNSPGEHGMIVVALSGLGRLALHWGTPTEARARIEQYLDAALACVSVGRATAARGLLARLLLAAGVLDEAAAALAEALRFYRRAGAKSRAAEALELSAALLATVGAPERAARLWGAAEALRERIGAPMWPCDRPDYERRVAAALAACPPDVWHAAWATGRALAWERAVDEALNCLERPA
jgi:predicted ATPase/transcriptional regulator with XRE-family HTH domain